MSSKRLSELGQQAQKQLRKRGLLHRLMPKSLMGRMLMILITPLLLVVIISLNVFLNRHLDAVSKQLARGISGEVAMVVDLIEAAPNEAVRARYLSQADSHLGIDFRLTEATAPMAKTPIAKTFWEPVQKARLERELAPRLKRDWHVVLIGVEGEEQGIARITITTTAGELVAEAPLKRLTSSSIPLFVMWLLVSAVVFVVIAALFLRNQMRPIRRLADAAEAFGKGEEQPGFKAQGAIEVRQAALAFLRMRDRLKRQIAQRTELLAGVSHDLRTPLTRMKLQLAMLDPSPETSDLGSDIDEMEMMINSYLSFARGEDQEQAREVDMTALLEERAEKYRLTIRNLHVDLDADMSVRARPLALTRCIDNLVGNASRHANAVWLKARQTDRYVLITIEDNGPGIPAHQREAMFSPFSRLDEGDDNPQNTSSGAGLGLSIARDIARRHGGDIELEASAQGGLKAEIRIPL